MKKRLIHIIAICFLATNLYAVIATPDPVWRQMPDGRWAEVYIRGDEHYHYLTTLTGELIPGTEVKSDFAVTERQLAQRVGQEMMLDAYVPSEGNLKIPVILVNFANLSFTMQDPIRNFSDFYNGSGGTNPNATGSVHDYFIASSDSALNLQFDVYGPYTLSKNLAYYGANSGKNHVKNARELVLEAANLACLDGVDFSQYDNNSDGVVDHVSIVVAGYNEAEGANENTIWPHYSTVHSSDTFSEKKLSGYLMISEYKGSGGKQQAGIGTYCHEFGHALGLPDLYDTQNSSRYTVGQWDVMCAGNYNNASCTPPSYSAFERFAMGWLKPLQLKEIGDYRLEPLLESNTSYLIAVSEHNLSPLRPTPNEYFLIENRQAVGWDANPGALVGTGMLISHITFNVNAWERNTFNNGTILGYAIVGAYDRDPAKSTPLDLYPGTGKVTHCLPTLNNGTELHDQRVQNIKELGDLSVSFSYGPLSNDGIFFSPEEIGTLVTQYDKRVFAYEEKQVEILVRNMQNDSLLIYPTNDFFEVSLDNGESWYNHTKPTYQLIPNDSVYVFRVLLRHRPHRQSCTLIAGFLTVESTKSLKMQQLDLSAYSPRPVYITQPILEQPLNITTNTFTAKWLPQEDAEFYYVTLYTLKDEKYTEKQTFDSFDSNENILKAGWDANFVRTTTLVAESNKAILFAHTGEYLTSNKQGLPINGCRFWVSNNYVSNNEETARGGLLVEGKRLNGEWIQIDSIRVINTTKNLTKTYSFTTNDSINQIRLSYTHSNGEGGCVVDGFEVYADQTIQYLRKGTDSRLLGSDTTAVFYDLEASTTYYWALQAYENKSCHENYSPLSKIQTITTLGEDELVRDLIISRQSTGEYVVELPEPSKGATELCVYTAQGALIHSQAIPYQTTHVILPILPTSRMYLLKLVEFGKMNRKAASAKLIN